MKRRCWVQVLLALATVACVATAETNDANTGTDTEPSASSSFDTVVQILWLTPNSTYNGSRRYEKIKTHLLHILSTPTWRDKFYTLIRQINARMNVSNDSLVLGRRVSAVADLRSMLGKGRYSPRSTDGAEARSRRRAKTRQGRTMRCPKLYQEAYCLYGECQVTLNFNLLMCRCPPNAQGDYCELRRVEQCFDHGGRRLVEQRRRSALYAAARQPLKVVVEHVKDEQAGAVDNPVGRLTPRKNEEVRCSRRLCKNRGTCTEVPGVTFHCECDDGYGEKSCSYFIVYHLLRELWDAEEAKRIGQNEEVDLVAAEIRLVEGFADAVCAQRWDGSCRGDTDPTTTAAPIEDF